ncbi:MAG: SLBB domain-containing protein [Bacteroidales bacterium]|nr:SLBB domain-containing protein [Bacteroidales bacterium]
MRKKILLLSMLLIFMSLPVMSQTMTDDEVLEYVKKATEQGVSQKQIVLDLAAKGVTRAQAERIKEKYDNDKKTINSKSAVDKNRMRNSVELPEQMFADDKKESDLKGEKPATRKPLQGTRPYGTATTDSYLLMDEDELMLEEEEEDFLRNDKNKKYLQFEEGDTIEIFGRSIFQNRDLTFAPNQNIATPDNYKLGPGDEVIIDIWGASQNSIMELISPDGYISLQDLGLIYLNGKTIKEASEYVKQELNKIYSGIGDENSSTKVKLTLGQIRTIQVNVMGEVLTPGTYSLSSLSSVFHAIYSAGGTNHRGSLRNIQIVRSGKKVNNVDLYSFILKGEDLGDIRLQDGDAIIVPTYESLVNIEGSVKRPMYYEMKSGETLADLLSFSGDFLGDAYKNHIQITRKNDKEYEICTVDKEEYASFSLMDGDKAVVGEIIERFTNKLEIKGAVYRPGIYQFGDKIKTVKQLIEKADGVMGDAFLNRAVMHREHADLTLEVIQVDVKGILNGTTPDIPLQKGDVLYIPSIHDLKDLGTISVYGEVARPGDFTFAENTTIEDIIIQAGGLKEAASTVRVDVSRRIKDNKGTQALNETGEMFSFSIKEGFVIDGTPGFILEPYDQVFVRKSPSYKKQINVHVKGEILYEGTYALTHRNERLSDLVKKAGGIIDGAYVKGARLVRRINEDERVKMEKTLDLVRQNADSLDMNKLELGDVYYVGIDLEAAIKKPGTSVDLVLREGDILDIPEMNNTVRISGAVLYPNTVVFEDGQKVSHYVEQAGGYAPKSKKNKTYVLYMNGQVAKAKKSSKNVIEPGCEIIVPNRSPKVNLQNIMAFATSAASLATMVATIANISK